MRCVPSQIPSIRPSHPPCSLNEAIRLPVLQYFVLNFSVFCVTKCTALRRQLSSASFCLSDWGSDPKINSPRTQNPKAEQPSGKSRRIIRFILESIHSSTLFYRPCSRAFSRIDLTRNRNIALLPVQRATREPELETELELELEPARNRNRNPEPHPWAVLTVNRTPFWQCNFCLPCGFEFGVTPSRAPSSRNS